MKDLIANRMLINARLYREWVQANGLDDPVTDPLLDLFKALSIQTSTTFCVFTTSDRSYAFEAIKDKLESVPEISLYHHSLLGRYQYQPSEAIWRRLGGESFNEIALLEYAQRLNEPSIIVIEDLVPLLRNPFIGEKILTALKRLHKGIRASGQIIIFIESPSAISQLPEHLVTEFLPLTTGINARLVNLPDNKGLFHRGELTYFLPLLRACCVTSENVYPTWRPDTWKPLEARIDGSEIEAIVRGYTRFLRSDQTLDWINESLPENSTKATLAVAISRALNSWLIHIDDPLPDRFEILDSRVEAIYFSERRRRRNRSVWFGNRKWSPRKSENFSDEMRSNLQGLDPVHTPENARAGLTRFLSTGWQVNDSGCLAPLHASSIWGPSTSRIPHRLYNEPRRLMLGASLQTRAVDLQKDLNTWTDRPSDEVDDKGWFPPGVDLRLGFSSCGGWTHEDGIVLSQSASEKLRNWKQKNLVVRIPSIASRIEMLAKQDALISKGAPLVKAYIDLYALGWGVEAAKKLAKEWGQSSQDGWIEVRLRHSNSATDGRILEIKREQIVQPLKIDDPGCFFLQFLKKKRFQEEILRWRELITFVLEISRPAGVGDKLATRHGIKGVVSRILPDNDSLLPKVGEQHAEVVLSPIGVARRGAMGQFRETTAHVHLPPQDADFSELPRTGKAWITRQPQDAEERCRARGVDLYSETRGQRYGEMEFWALMAHGVQKIAMELLSPGRSTAPWIYWERKTGDSKNHRKLALRALNRYLASVNAQVKGGSLISPADPRSFVIPIGTHGSYRDALDLLDDDMGFARKGGLGVIKLRDPITIFLERSPLTLSKIYVLPPWLRPPTAAGQHPLTKAYAKLFKALQLSLFARDSLAPVVRRCIALTLHKDFGVHSFLRREVLGRRLTRSARAVVVPCPDLQIDEIKMSKEVAESIFSGLPKKNRELVLVNRNPTLHRYGLLALRPIVIDSYPPVFGLPLGILKMMGADFDGDQVTIVALEGEEALDEAKRLVPGATDQLRLHPFRNNIPAFPLLQELSLPEEELELASKSVDECALSDWVRQHKAILEDRLDDLAKEGGWPSLLISKQMRNENSFWNQLNEWNGLDEVEMARKWLALANDKMEVIYKGVRKKGRFGGILRRQLYRRAFINQDQFFKSIAALQTVTEPLVQSVLTIKTGKGASTFNPGKYFGDPTSRKGKESLRNLEKELDPDRLADALGKPRKPSGLLAWLASPNTETLLRLLASTSELGTDNDHRNDDPRIGWFLS